MLFIFSNFSKENKKYYSKILIHLLIGLILADIFWFIFISPIKNYKKTVNVDYMESLDSLHSFCFFMGILEILIKLVILALTLYDYRNFFYNDINFLLNFNYKIPEHPIEDVMMSKII